MLLMRVKGWPLQVSYANYAGPFLRYIEGALDEIGVGRSVEGFNSGRLEGAQYCSSTIRPESQTRDSSQTSFLEGKQCEVKHILLTKLEAAET